MSRSSARYDRCYTSDWSGKVNKRKICFFLVFHFFRICSAVAVFRQCKCKNSIEKKQKKKKQNFKFKIHLNIPSFRIILLKVETIVWPDVAWDRLCIRVWNSKFFVNFFSVSICVLNKMVKRWRCLKRSKWIERVRCSVYKNSSDGNVYPSLMIPSHVV